MHRIITFIIFGLLVIFSFGTILAYNNYKIINPPNFAKDIFDSFVLLSPLPQNSRMVWSAARRKMATVKSVNLEGEIKSFKDSKQTTVNFKGPLDLSEKNKFKISLDIDATVNEGEKSSTFSGSTVLIADTLYFKFTNMEGDFLPLGQWFYVDGESLAANLASIWQRTKLFVEDTYDYSSVSSSGFNYTITIKAPPEKSRALTGGISGEDKIDVSLEEEEIMELKVGKFNHLLKEISFYDRNSPQAESISVKLSGHNNKFEITAPEGALDLNQYFIDKFASLFQSFFLNVIIGIFSLIAKLFGF